MSDSDKGTIWESAPTEIEPSNPQTEELNPIYQTPEASTSPTSSPITANTPDESANDEAKNPRVSLDQAAVAVELLILKPLNSLWLRRHPPTRDEAEALADPLLEGLPPWAWAWPIRALSAAGLFVSNRWPPNRPKPVNPDAEQLEQPTPNHLTDEPEASE